MPSKAGISRSWAAGVALALAVMCLDRSFERVGRTSAFAATLVWTAASMDRFHSSRWPFSCLPRGALQIRRQALGLLSVTLPIAGPALVVSLGHSQEHPAWHLACIYGSFIASLTATAVLLLQLEISREARSISLVLLAWVLPSVLSPSTTPGLLLHASFGSARSLAFDPSPTWVAGASGIASIVAVLASALCVAEIRTPRP